MQAGLVRRVADSGDRRRVIIEPLYKNMAGIGALFQPMAEQLAGLWSEYSDEELAVVLRFVRESNAVIVRENTRIRGLGD